MKSEFVRLLSTALFGAALLGACDEAPSASGELEPVVADEATAITPASLGLGDGWIALEPGLWTRSDVDGAHEFLGVGETGKAHALASLEEAEAQLEQNLAATNPAETRAQLDELRGFIAGLYASEAAEELDATTLRCTLTQTGNANAGPIACGVSASASAFWSHTCSASQVQLKTYALASCGSETKTHQCGPKGGNPVSCNSSTSITGAGPCKSSSYAILPGSYLWKENYVRGACGGGGGGGGGGGDTPTPGCPIELSDCQQK